MMHNSLDNLSELTIVIPSYEREDYLKRQILFWSNYTAKIVILDGSKKSLSKDSILENKTNYLNKKENLKKLNYQNSWINVNQKILRNINEN